jgi:DNA-binding transcriptional regulator GbsR (MarR family)
MYDILINDTFKELQSILVHCPNKMKRIKQKYYITDDDIISIINNCMTDNIKMSIQKYLMKTFDIGGETGWENKNDLKK